MDSIHGLTRVVFRYPQRNLGIFFWFLLKLLYICFMDNQTVILIYLVVVFWGLSSFYVLNWAVNHNRVNVGIILVSFLLGPILAIFVRISEKETKENIIEDNNRRMDETHRRWFQLSDRIGRERMHSNWFRTIPPPPPISQKKNTKINDFKFLQNK